jgi:PIN domain nuclease of toxin-antitoxin system
MILLLDTHTVLWVTEDNPRLGKAARRACDRALVANEIAISTIAYYEIGYLLNGGVMTSADSVRDWRTRILALGVRELQVTAEVAVRASDLENLLRDPMDRLIVATALVDQAVLLTADQALLAWQGPLKRQDARR